MRRRRAGHGHDRGAAQLTAATPPAPAWWRDAAVYQIYVRSFADADGDGIGDLAGIRSRVGYLADLGVDAVWLTPCYPSPQYDHGYDVADYFAIEPQYGDLAEFDRLVAALRAAGIKVVMDIVPNHCSIDHAWFREAVGSPPGSPARRRFWIRPGRHGGTEPPNNWRAWFGGAAWSPMPDGSGEWYLHQFTPWQPDLDWNHPDVVDHFDRVLRFWFDRGVEGFRVDAVIGVGKHPDLPDAPVRDGRRETDRAGYNPYMVFRPEGHVVWRHWRRTIDEYEATHPGRSLYAVSEAYTPRRPDVLAQFANAAEFHQSFSFDLLLSPWHASSWRQAIEDSRRVLVPAGVAPVWVLNNHDVQRCVTRYGRADAADPASWTGNNLMASGAPVDVEVGRRRARCAALVYLALPGAAYLYQGEELGLAEVLDIPPERREDPIFVRTEGRELGRDGCRVPMPWTAADPPRHGFSAPGGSSPWLPTPDGWGAEAVDRQADDARSVLSLYRRALSLRRRRVPHDHTDFEWHDLGPDVLAFRSGRTLVVANFGAEPARVPTGRVVLASVPDAVSPDGGSLGPDAAVWIDE